MDGVRSHDLDATRSEHDAEGGANAVESADTISKKKSNLIVEQFLFCDNFLTGTMLLFHKTPFTALPKDTSFKSTSLENEADSRNVDHRDLRNTVSMSNSHHIYVTNECAVSCCHVAIARPSLTDNIRRAIVRRMLTLPLKKLTARKFCPNLFMQRILSHHFKGLFQTLKHWHRCLSKKHSHFQILKAGEATLTTTFSFIIDGVLFHPSITPNSLSSNSCCSAILV